MDRPTVLRIDNRQQQQALDFPQARCNGSGATAQEMSRRAVPALPPAGLPIFGGSNGSNACSGDEDASLYR
jgi:hypothetical protein